MKKVIFIISALALALVLVLSASTPPTGRQWKKWSNPLFEGWYADPEGIVIDDQLWIYPTYSKPFKEQLHLDAFSSRDLKKWTKHERIISNVEISWLKEALWAPSIVQKDGKYYLFFSCNNIRDDKYGGIGVAVAESAIGHGHGMPHIAMVIFQNTLRNDPLAEFRNAVGRLGRCP